MNKAIIWAGIIFILAFSGIIWISKPDYQNKTAAISESKNETTLTVEEADNFDFGSISMAAGKVSHAFRIKNISKETATIEKIYTSCMCTTAMLTIKGQQLGPFGMPGHGVVKKINQALESADEAVVEVIFDPAAHGPAGVGRIERVVIIENDAGKPVELSFAATVTP